MIGATYRAVRRKAASFLNGTLMPRFGVKIVRSWPKSFRYTKLEAKSGRTRLAVTGGAKGETVEVSLREGTSDWMTFDQIFVEEDYDLRPLSRYGELAEHYRRLCKQGTPLIIDLGGNIGLSPLYFSMMWPEAQVVTVEPEASNFELLSENIAQRSNVRGIRAGIASRSSKLDIADPKAGKNAFQTELSDQGSVEGVTVGEIVAEYRAKGCVPFAVKIDIEGAESELFSANHEWMDEFPLVTVELHDWLLPGQRTSRNFLAAVAEKDRDFIYLDENIFSIRNGLGAA
ncbi:MAG: methyltransferase FkbM family [Alphaproteobacteria bacterium]|nr:methyltransferase FkbM family [Alphaproteobacteria bacterium]